MLVIGMDNRNISVAIDLVQAKLIVALLQSAAGNMPALVLASERVNLVGFSTTGFDTEAARSSMVSVLKPFLDNCVHKSHPLTAQDPTAPPPEVDPEDEEAPPEKKDAVN